MNDDMKERVFLEEVKGGPLTDVEWEEYKLEEGKEAALTKWITVFVGVVIPVIIFILALFFHWTHSVLFWIIFVIITIFSISGGLLAGNIVDVDAIEDRTDSMFG